ncbi:MAG TPA: MlaD family protein [Ferrovibrio sp.]|uniref:MlaD family protein n=1 Tax=Ferrovibrio sp. TaxID=1917215 RepID=UPI002ED13DC2
METRAHHFLIGSFVLVFVAAIIVFSLWLAKSQVRKDVAYYNIYFSGSVAGLGVGGDVRFNGIKVGSVSQIVIDRQNTSQIRVTVEVDADTPIRSDSEATLQLQGITGISYVLISPGSEKAEFLPVVSSGGPGKYPVIPSRPSAIEYVVQAAPELVKRAVEVLSDENLKNLSGFLSDLHQISQILATRQDKIGQAIDGFGRTSDDIAQAAAAARQVATKLDRVLAETESTLNQTNKLVSGDATQAVQDARRAMQQLNATLAEIQAMVHENRGPLQAITTDGLGEFQRFIAEARIMVASLTRVAQRLEDNPSAVLFGNREPEYKDGGGRR